MVWYCNLESVKAALDEAETARSNAQIRDAIEQGARDVEGLCDRGENAFAPVLATRYYDYPSRTGRPPSWRIWFDGDTLISASLVTTENAATTLTAGQYFLEPRNHPPYTRIEVNLAGSGSFSAGGTRQRAIAITGLWGHSNVLQSVGSLSSSLGATTASTASLAWTTARFGIGDVLLIDSERIVINDRNFVDSGQNTTADLAASEAGTTVGVADGTAYAVEEILLVGSERMRIVDITGNSLTVKRAQDGSQLAAHTTGADVYALTGVELDRAQLGTTIAAHSLGATVYRWVPPALLTTLNRAYALNALLQERSGWARAMQAGADTSVEFSGRGIAKLERDVQSIFARKARTRAIVASS
jgi:hypothetical protein